MNNPIVFAFGCRDVVDAGLVASTLRAMMPINAEVWSGDARGADKLALEYARAHGLKTRSYAAAWNRPDGTTDMGAGKARTIRLIADLPGTATTICIAFAPRGATQETPARTGRVRDALSPGTRFTVGELLARGYNVRIVWSDGHIQELAAGRGPTPPAAREPTKADRLDMRTDDGRLGDFGWDASATAGRHVAIRFPLAPAAPTTHKFGDTVTDADGARWRVNFISADGLSVRLRPLHAPAGPYPERTIASVLRDENLGELASETRYFDGDQPPRGFGDAERRSRHFDETQAALQAHGRIIQCRVCGEVCSPPEDTHDLCPMCAEAAGT